MVALSIIFSSTSQVANQSRPLGFWIMQTPKNYDATAKSNRDLNFLFKEVSVSSACDDNIINE